MFDVLDDDNFLLYAAKSYDNPNCEDYEEFLNDLNRIKYVKRLLRKYKNDGDLNERLILNHLIVLYNTFLPAPCTRMLCLKLHDELDCLKPFLLYLNYWPERVEKIKIDHISKVVIDSDINMDMNIVNLLRKI